jgi:hypothetical protein
MKIPLSFAPHNLVLHPNMDYPHATTPVNKDKYGNNFDIN